MADFDSRDLPDAARTPARFTLAQFDMMIEAGVFDGPGSAELVRGEIVRVNAKYLLHIRSQRDLLIVLHTMLRGHPFLEVGSEPSILLGPDTTREPDVVVFRRQPRGAKRVPAADVLLVIEVAASSLSRDLGDKLADYARGGVPRVWIVDLGSETVHQCEAPQGDAYTRRRVARFGEPLSLAGVTDGEIVVPEGGFE